jgi:DNA-directed RNA polymerase specialized sigma24 family protein
MAGGIDSARCEALAARIAGDDEAAWQELVGHLWAELFGFVKKSRTMGRFRGSDDHVHDVLTRLVERLRRDGGHGLRLYAPWHGQNPDKTFADWIRIVTVNIMRRYVRERLALVHEGGAAPTPEAPGDHTAPLPSVKRLFNEFMRSPALDEVGVRPPYTDAHTAQELLVFAQTRLPEVRYRALMMWIEGASFEEIAGALALCDAGAAERTVRAATAVLRRHFAGGGEAGPAAPHISSSGA